MENVVLIIHLLLALGLILVVLMQRSEGGGLGIGGGGGAMSARGSATALGKLTWVLAIAFIITSITLTIIAAEKASGSSVMDRLGNGAPASAPSEDGLPDTDGLLPPPSGEGDTPVVPRAD